MVQIFELVWSKLFFQIVKEAHRQDMLSQIGCFLNKSL